ncbi:MAG: bifunctional ornithine acetyltransferase/N-acetylglutamate synthase, partial [Lachnospiraceae bacterium]
IRENVKDTFNMVSVDGDTSTNDTLLIMANGLAGNPEITEKNADYKAFCEALLHVNTQLARLMAGDGEGATALVETHVYHAPSKEEARLLAKSVICSSLTKAAIFGHDANWGRVLCALGYSGVRFDPEKIELFFAAGEKKIQIFKDGVATDYSEEEASEILSMPEVQILVDMKAGDSEAKAWGCDLTYDYVKINADYRS